MADQQIEDLDELTEPDAVNDELIVNDDSDDTNDDGGEPKRMKLWRAGGLKYVQVTGADITDQTTHFEYQANAGELLGIDMATIDAAGSASADNENLRILFPNSPSEGDVFGYVIESESDNAGTFAQAPGYCCEVEGGATHTIRGENITPVDDGGSKWSLWLRGELVIFRYIGSTWYPVQDGRIPAEFTCHLDSTTTGTYISATDTFYDVPFDTVDRDNFNGWNSTNHTYEVKRTSSFWAACTVAGASLSDEELITTRLWDGTTSFIWGYESMGGADPGGYGGQNICEDCASQVALEVEVRRDTSTGEILGSSSRATYMALKECRS